MKQHDMRRETSLMKCSRVFNTNKRLELTFGLWGLNPENLENPGKFGKSERNLLTCSDAPASASPWLVLVPRPFIDDKDECEWILTSPLEYLTPAAVVGRLFWYLLNCMICDGILLFHAKQLDWLHSTTNCELRLRYSKSVVILGFWWHLIIKICHTKRGEEEESERNITHHSITDNNSEITDGNRQPNNERPTVKKPSHLISHNSHYRNLKRYNECQPHRIQWEIRRWWPWIQVRFIRGPIGGAAAARKGLLPMTWQQEFASIIALVYKVSAYRTIPFHSPLNPLYFALFIFENLGMWFYRKNCSGSFLEIAS